MRDKPTKSIFRRAFQAYKFGLSFLVLLFILTLSGDPVSAQTITSLSPSCATVGESISLLIRGEDFIIPSHRNNGEQYNTKVIIKGYDSNGTLVVDKETLVDPIDANLIRMDIPASVYLTKAGQLSIQVATRAISNNYGAPSTAVFLPIYAKLSTGPVTGVTSVCAMSTHSYSISSVAGAKGYEWSVISGDVTFLSGSDQTTVQVRFGATGGQVKLGVRAINQCDFKGPITEFPSPASSFITVNPMPVVTVTNPAAVCFPNTVNITTTAVRTSTTTGLDYTYWRDAAATTTLLTNPEAVTTSGTYFIKATNPTTSCATVQAVVVTVNPLPELRITNPAAVCSPNTVNLTAEAVTAGSTAGLTYTYWTNSSATTALTNPSAVAVSGTYYIKGTNPTTSCATVQSVIVTVNPLPVVTVTNPAAVCFPNTVNITTTAVRTSTTTGLDYTYWRDAAATTTLLTNPEAVTTSGTYFIKGTNPTTTCFTIQPVVVTINPLPELRITNPAAVCSPNTVNLTADAVTAGSTAGLTYTYWTNSSATTALTNPSAVAVSGTYYIKGTNPTTSCATVQSVIVTVNPLPVVTVTNPAAVCFPNTVNITTTAVRTSTTTGLDYTYWRDAAATTTLLTNPEAVTTSGTYFIKGTNPTTSCATVQAVVVTVNPLPELRITNPAAVCSPNTVNLTADAVTAGSTAGLTYTYWTNSSATTALTNPSAVAVSGTYYIKGTNPTTSCATVQAVTVTINPLPTLSSSTAEVTICSSLPFIYTPTSATERASFTWKRDIVSGISPEANSGSGEIRETLINSTLEPIVVTYIITTTSEAGCSTVNNLTVIVNPQPKVELTPTGPTNFCTGNSVTLEAPSGYNKYEWYESRDGIIYFIDNGGGPNHKITESGHYFVRVRNKYGCFTNSAPVTVKVVRVDDSYAHVTYTGATSFCEGGSLLLQSASNSSYLYQWRNGTTIINGATTSKYIATVSGTYTVTISSTVNGVNCVKTSEPITVTVTPTIFNTLSATDVTICSGGTAPQLVGNAATGGDGVNYVYTWESSITSASTGFTAISNSNSVNYSPGVLTQTTWFRRRVKSGTCDVFTTPIRVTVNPVITNNALTLADQVVCTNQTAPTLTGTVPAGGNGAYTYQWQSSPDGTTFTNVTGATTQNYSPGTMTQTTWFRRIANSGACSSTSGSMKVQVTPLITNFQVSAAQTICSGGSPIPLTGVPAGGDGNFAYQWERSSNGTSFTVISGATSQQYSPGTLTADTWYRRSVSSGNCSVYSDNIKITVLPPVVNTITTTTLRICEGGTAPQLIGNAATGGDGVNYVYTWESSITSASTGFTAISNSNSVNYSPGVLTQTTWFRRTAVSGPCTTPSPSASIQVEVTPNITNNIITTSIPTICYDGSTGTITGSTPGGGNGSSYAYRWESSTTSATEGFNLIPTATAKDLAPLTLRQTTWFRRTVISGSCNNGISNVMQVTVTPAVTNHVITGTSQYCPGATATSLKATFSGGSATPSTNTFQWQQSVTGTGTWNDILGSTGPEHIPSTTTVGTIFYRRLINTGGCTSQPSQSFAVTINPLPTTVAVPAVNTCVGITVPGISFSSPAANVTFSWTSTVDVGFGLLGTGNIPSFTAKNAGTNAVTATVTVNAISSTSTCVGTPMIFTVTVNPLPVVSFIPESSNGLKSSYCASQQAITLAGMGSPAGGTFTINGNQATVFNPSMLGAGTYTVRYTYRNPSTTCFNSADKIIVVNPLPAVSFTSASNEFDKTIYSAQKDFQLVGSPAGGTWTWPGITNTSSNTFSPCAAFAEAIKTNPNATEVNVTISYTVRNSSGCENTATRTIKIKKSTYSFVIISSEKPFCKGDNVIHTVRVYRDAILEYPYLVNAAGDPVRADMVTPIGPQELPIANPNYPFPAGTTPIQKALAYRFFQPRVLNDDFEILSASQFTTYQWTKNQTTNQGNNLASYTNAGLSSLEYYATYVTGTVCGQTFDKKLTYRAYGGIVDEYTVSVSAANTTICSGQSTTFTANLNNSFPWWSVVNLQLTWTLKRGSSIYTIKNSQGVGSLDLTTTEIEAALRSQNVSPATLQSTDVISVNYVSDLDTAFGNDNSCKVTTSASSISITVVPSPTISTNLQASAAVCAGQRAAFSFTTPGTTGITINWYKVGVATPLSGGDYTITNTTSGSGNSTSTTSTLAINTTRVTDAGSYYASVTNNSTTCTTPTNQTVLVVNAVPVAQTMNGGNYCPYFTPGVALILSSSQVGMQYNLYRGTTLLSTMNGTGSALNFGVQTAGSYTVTGVGEGACTNTNIASAIITTTTSTTPVNGTLRFEWVPWNTFRFTAIESTAGSFGTNPNYMWYTRSRLTAESAWTFVERTTVNTRNFTNMPADTEVKCEVLPTDGRCTMFIMMTNAAVPFPVELIGFKADKKGEHVLLSWTTAVEKNNRGFDVQVSEDGVNYRSLAFVASKNSNSSVKLTYSYTDTEKNKRLIRYYRLKQVDTDNTATFFGPLSVNFGEFGERITAYPNPFDTAISFEIETDEAGEVEVTMSNITGKRLLSRTIQVQQGKGTYTLQVEKTTPAGAYIITTRKGDQVQHFRLIRQ